MTRITKQPQERRREILNTALELFLKNGYEKTSVSDIVQKLNVAQGLFYYYFKSKEEVFKAALEQYTDEFAARLEAIIRDSSIPFMKRVKLVLDSMQDMFSQSSKALMEGIQHSVQLDMDYRLSLHAAQMLVEPIAEVLEETNAKGFTKIENIMATAAFLAFGIYGLIHGNPRELHNSHFLNLEVVIKMIANVLGVTPEFLMKI